MRSKGWVLSSALFFAAFSVSLHAQTTPANSGDSKDGTVTFKSRVNVVLVPVVVRDGKGNAVGNLRKEDFQVFDEGKPQTIAYFTVETPESRAAEAKAQQSSMARTGAPAVVIPRRFVAYVLDDLHMSFEEIVWTRQAAEKQFARMRPDDRFALFTVSGRNTVPFTDDTAKIREALLKISPQAAPAECPDLGANWADLIERMGFPDTHSDSSMRGATAGQVDTANLDPLYADGLRQFMACPGNDTAGAGMAFRAYIQRTLALYDRDTRITLVLLNDVVGRMSILPGERTVVMVSPGFVIRNRNDELAGVVDLAARHSIAVNTVDPRGVYNPGSDDDAKQRPGMPVNSRYRYMVKSQESQIQAGVLEELADGTGGVFFHSNNDLVEGFRRTAEAPEYSYMLGFSPQELKEKVHTSEFRRLKVTVNGYKNSAVHARRGYFVAKTPTDAAVAARNKVQELMYSRDEVQGIPIKLRTEFFKTSEKDATLSIGTRIDLNALPLRKEDSRSRDDLLVYAALFDRNGAFIAGKAQTVELRLSDASLERYRTGLNVKSDLAVDSGNYLARVVVKDSEGQLISAVNRGVYIPEDYAVEARAAAIQQNDKAAAMQAAHFYTSPDSARVDVTAAITAAKLQFQPHNGKPHATLNVWGLASRKDGTVAARFSDSVDFDFESEDEVSRFKQGSYTYEKQFAMAPGQYTLKMTFSSENSDLAKAEAPLDIAPNDGNQLSLGGLALCREMRPVNGNNSTDRVPLVSRGVEYIPSGAARFAKTDTAGVYFELYEPRLKEARPASLQFRVRVLDRNDEVVDDSEAMTVSLSRWTDAVLPVGWKLPIEELKPGAYKVEVTATESGDVPLVRTAEFEVQ